MKQTILAKYIKQALIGGLIATSSFLVTGCSSNNDSNGGAVVDTQPPVIPEAAKSSLLVQVLDAAGKPVSGASVVVVEDAQNVVDDEDNAKVLTDADNGFVNYDLNDFTGEKNVKITASKEGFLSNTISIDVASGDNSEGIIAITEISNTSVEGVAITESAPVDITQGSLTAIAVDQETNEQKVEVIIPQGVEATAADGVTKLTGEITTVVAHYESETAASLESFPGGFTASIENPEEVDAVAINPDAPVTIPNEVIFKSAGFTAVEVKDENGNSAKTFNTPISITMRIPAGTVNPNTKQEIKEGDIIPVWSFEADSGKWNYEGEGTVSKGIDGVLEVKRDIEHLSYWNLDWFDTANCDARINLQTPDGSPYPLPLSGNILGTDGGWSHSVKYVGDGFIDLVNSPASFDVELALFDYDGKPLPALSINGVPGKQSFNLCENNSGASVADATNTITFPAPPEDINPVEITIKGESYCTNNANEPAQVITSSKVYVVDGSNNNFTGILETGDETGEATLSLLPSTDYRFYFFDRVNGLWVFQAQSITTDANQVVTFRVGQECEVVDGTGATGGTGI